MFDKNHRLTKKKEIEKVFKEGRSTFNKSFGLKVLDNQLRLNRFTVIVSLKVSKSAVERNKIKRRIREILRKEEKKIKSGEDIIVITLPPIINLKYDEIHHLLKNSLKKLNIYL